MNDFKIYIVIPIYNEELLLPKTLNSLLSQKDEHGELFSPTKFEIVLIDNNSNDNSSNIIDQYIVNFNSIKITKLFTKKGRHIQSRIDGCKYILDQETKLNDIYIMNADADTVFPENWFRSIVNEFSNPDISVLSFAGYYDPILWKKIPLLAEKYYNEVGTIFFDNTTIENFGFSESRCLFSKQLFNDFGRPMSDCGFAIRADVYKKSGGYSRDYYDVEKKKEIYAEGWVLKFKIDKINSIIKYVPFPYYQTSPRRILHEPEVFLGRKSYTDGMSNIRNPIQESHYEKLSGMINELNMQNIREYITEYYIFMQCITNLNLLELNKSYFGKCFSELKNIINNWHSKNLYPSYADILNFCTKINKRFHKEVIANINSNYG